MAKFNSIHQVQVSTDSTYPKLSVETLKGLYFSFRTWIFAWYKAVEEAVIWLDFLGQNPGAFCWPPGWGVPCQNWAGKREVATWAQPPGALESFLSPKVWNISRN